MALDITCYRAEVFQSLLATRDAQLPQDDFDLEIPIGPIANRIRDGQLELSYDPSAGKLYLYAKKGITFEFGSGHFKLHPQIEALEDLHGGACSLRVTAMDYEKNDEIRAFDSALRYGGACLHLILAPNTHTPVWYTSYLPLGGDLAAGQLWGILPDSNVKGTVDDLACQ
jgi:hypothetical protein